MGVINASALTALQTRINAERSRRGLGSVTFTGGVGSGQAIQAAHFNELRNATEGLNTLGSQTFNWTGTIATGASITDVLPQIDNFVTTLESEVLASWQPLSPIHTYLPITNGEGFQIFEPPEAARGVGKFRWKINTSYVGRACITWRWLRTKHSTIAGNDGMGWNAEGYIHTGTPETTNMLGGYSLADWHPWYGSYGDYTLPPIQTPYEELVNKDNNRDTVDYPSQSHYNISPGAIYHSDCGPGEWYMAKLNYWYTNPEAFNSTDKRYAVMYANNYIAEHFDDVQVEAYY